MSSPVRKTLVFPAGTEIGLEIHEALRQCKEVQLVGAGIAATNHGQFAYSDYHSIPAVSEPGWFEALDALCCHQKIEFIFPAHDDVVVALAEQRERLSAVVLAPVSTTCYIARSKRETYEALATIVRVPAIFDPADLNLSFPLLVKPDRGQGSKDIRLVYDRVQLAHAVAHTAEPLVCEYLPGEEYTVDCFSDREHGLLFAGARARNRTRNGISVNTMHVELEGATAIAEAIHKALQMRGAWFFQLKRAVDGQLCLLEVAPRIAGSMALHRAMGVNFPLLTIFESERRPLGILLNQSPTEMDRALRNRFRHEIAFEYVYIDLDDTVIHGDWVDPDMIAFIVTCRNRGCRVTLISRHADVIDGTLERLGLTGLFHHVVHLTRRELKSDYIEEPNAIFIDDSYAERLEVAKRRRIPTFDPSMVSCLMA